MDRSGHLIYTSNMGYYMKDMTEARWAIIRNTVAAKYHGICVYCLNECNKPTVDHKIPRCKGGGHELSNLVLACKGCNSHKRTRTYQEMRLIDKRLSLLIMEHHNMKPSKYSQYYRVKQMKKAVELYQRGLSVREVAIIVGKSKSCVAKAVKKDSLTA